MLNIVCTTKGRISDVSTLGDNSTRVFVRVNIPTDPGATNGYGDIVICGDIPMSSFTGFFAPWINGRHLQSRIQMRLEKSLAGFPAGPTNEGEDDPTGQGWSWCEVPS